MGHVVGMKIFASIDLGIRGQSYIRCSSSLLKSDGQALGARSSFPGKLL